jgi:GNAT superfamily N-acetyltransferase
MNVNLHEIENLNDPQLIPWLDLYQTAFPLTEQIKVSVLIETLQRASLGLKSSHIFWIEAEYGNKTGFAGLIWYEIEEKNVVFLWYLAIHEEMRDKGIGSLSYQKILTHLREQGIRVLVFEIEHPEDPKAEPELALRRRNFYQRNGARCAVNVHYMQSIGWQPSVRMWLMAHSLDASVTKSEMESALWDVFGSSATCTESIAWE